MRIETKIKQFGNSAVIVLTKENLEVGGFEVDNFVHVDIILKNQFGNARDQRIFEEGRSKLINETRGQCSEASATFLGLKEVKKAREVFGDANENDSKMAKRVEKLREEMGL